LTTYLTRRCEKEMETILREEMPTLMRLAEVTEIATVTLDVGADPSSESTCEHRGSPPC